MIMPDAVKISELPSRAAVFTDILPAIDVNFAQTVRVTAQDIAALGGGPPGDATVTTAKLVNGSVTYPKIQNVTQDKILGRATAGAGVVEEIACTPFARTVLAAATSAEAVAALGALASTVDPEFTGAVKLPDGTASAPSLTYSDDRDTGLFSPYDNNLGFATDGYERLRIAEDGSQYSNFPGTAISTELRPHYTVRAWIHFNGLANAGNTFTINSQHTICQRYTGQWGSLLNDAATQARIAALEQANSSGTQSITQFGVTGTEGRPNYTTPGDNNHFRWNGSNFVSTPATSGSWIGNITITSNQPINIVGSGNISSISRNSAGIYDISFVAPMPDATYCVVASCSSSTAANAGVCRIINPAVGGFRVTTSNMASGALFDPGFLSIVIVR